MIKKFDFNNLPLKVYDSSGFLPFSKKPESATFDWDKLTDTDFDFNNLPSKPLKFETSILASHELIKAGPPRLRSGTSGFIYELQSLAGDEIDRILEDKDGFLWIATDQNLYRYDGENLELYVHIKNYYTISSILEDTQGKIWIGIHQLYSKGGIIIIDTKAGIVKQLVTSKGIDEEGINTLFLDDKGRIWATSQFGAVFIIDEYSGTIKQFSRPQGLSGVPYEIIQDNKNNIWISTLFHGVNILDLKNGKIKYLTKSAGLNTDSVFEMQLDNMNKVWLKGRSGKLNSVDVTSGKIMHYDNVFSKNNSFYQTFSLLNDKRGNIWIGEGAWGENDKPTNGVINGVIIIDPANELIKTMKTSDGLSSNNVGEILQDKRGQIWLATTAGLDMVKENNSDNNISAKQI